MNPFEDSKLHDDLKVLDDNERRMSVDAEEDRCLICLQKVEDRTILPQCSHDSYCFSCILEWAKHSSKCPLCVADIGPFIIHKVRSKHDYQRYFITPALSPKASTQSRSLATTQGGSNAGHGTRSSHYRCRQGGPMPIVETDAAVLRRRNIYAKGLFAKHVATNRYTGYKPPPTPAQISASIELQRRARAFLRRELQVWVNLDIEFLINYIISLIKMLDLRSESGIKLLADLLDPSIPYSEETRKPNTEHLAHELYSFLRSPFQQLEGYDEVVQYDSSSSHSFRPLRSPISRRRPRHRPASRSPVRSQREHSNAKRLYVEAEHTNMDVHPIQGDVMPPLAEARVSPSPSNEPDLPRNLIQTGSNNRKPLLGDDDMSPSTEQVHSTTVESNDGVMPASSQTGLIKKIRSEITRRRQMGPPDIVEPGDASGSSQTDPPERIPSTSSELTALRRQELLSRLECERTKLEETQSLEKETMPMGNAAGGLQIKGAANKAKELMEKRLKSEAILRVRLAREKAQLMKEEVGIDASPKEHESASTILLIPADVESIQTPAEGSVSVQHKLRERLLKERLLARKNGLDSSI